MSGNPYYYAFGVADTRKARAFFGTVFDWDIGAGNLDDGWHIGNAAFPGGMMPTGRSGDGDVVVYLDAGPHADDVDPLVRRVVELGGTATEPQRSPSGIFARCTDDQGTVFGLGWSDPEFLAGHVTPPPLAEGELGFLTFAVPDVGRAATFFSSLFGWEISEPSIENGHEHRHVSSTELPLGFTNDTPRPSPVLYFKVTSPDEAHARVLRAGGSGEAPQHYRSGASTICTDDQGTRFGLWQPADGFAD